MSADLIQQVKALDDEQRAELADLLAPHVSIGRRSFLGLAGVAGGAAMVPNAARAATQEAVQPAAAADGVLSDIDTFESGDGTVMTAGNAIQHANEAVSSATTIGNVCYIEVDTSVAGFTVTIPASLEASGLELRFVDAGGSAGTNSYDIDSTNWNIDGSATKTIDTSDTITVLYSAGDRWISNGFIDTVEAGSVVTNQLNTAPTGTLVTLDGDQTIADDTVTKIAWADESSRGEVSGLLNASNEVVVPDGFSWAKCLIWVDLIFAAAVTDINVLRARINGNGFTGSGAVTGRSYQEEARTAMAQTVWFGVSAGDAITSEIRFGTTEANEDLRDGDGTCMEVWLI